VQTYDDRDDRFGSKASFLTRCSDVGFTLESDRNSDLIQRGFAMTDRLPEADIGGPLAFMSTPPKSGLCGFWIQRRNPLTAGLARLSLPLEQNRNILSGPAKVHVDSGDGWGGALVQSRGPSLDAGERAKRLQKRRLRWREASTR
jgi:hypothetical protein